MTTTLASSNFALSINKLANLQESQHEYLEVLYYLCAEGGAAPRPELERVLTRMGRDDAKSIILALSKAELIHSKRIRTGGSSMTIVEIHPGLDKLFNLPAFYQNHLRQKLANLDLTDLKHMAASFYSEAPEPAPESGRNPIPLLASFKSLIIDRESFKNAVDKNLTNSHKVILKILSMFPHGLTLRELSKNLSYFGEQIKSDDLKLELVHLFRTTGLIFTSSGDQLLRREQYFPSDMKIMLVRDAAEMIKSNFGLSSSPRQIYPEFAGRFEPESWKVRHEPSMLISNALIVLIYIINHRVARIQKGGIHKSEVKRIIQMLNPVQDDAHLFNYIFDYFEQFGVLQDNKEIWAIDVSRAESFFADPDKSFMEMLVDYYGADPTRQKDLDSKLESGDSGVLDPLRVLWLLRFISPNVWLTESELTFLYTQAEIGDQSSQKHTSIEKFINYQLEQPLLWFGLVELSHHPEVGELLFRLSSRGKAILQDGKYSKDMADYIGSGGKILVQANMEIFQPADFAPAGTMFLARFADFERNQFRISSQSISRGLDSGLDLKKIRGFLEKSSSQEIPQNVNYLLNEVSSRHGHILIDPELMLLKTENPFLLKELSMVPSMRRYFLASFSDTIMLLEDGVKIPRMVDELRKLGYMPRISWETVIEEPEMSLELDTVERHDVLAILKAFEYSDVLENALTRLLSQVNTQLHPDNQKLRNAIPQRKLGEAYKSLERLNKLIAGKKLR
jgi:hypothetical protein